MMERIYLLKNGGIEKWREQNIKKTEVQKIMQRIKNQEKGGI